MSRRVVARLLIGAAACGMMLSGCGFGATAGDLLPWRVGAVYPLSGPQGDDGAKELAGVQLAAQLVNQDGGVDGRRIAVSSADAPASTDAAAAVDSVLGRGAQMIIGSYGSTISIPASARASAAGALYLETGAVADTVTARGLPGVLRTVATGSTLGRNAARFAHDTILPRLGLHAGSERTVILFEDDTYGMAVGYGSIDEASQLGLHVVDTIRYDAGAADFASLAARVDGDRPDLILTASYLQDGVAFQRAAIARHLQVRAIVGTSSAYCREDFGAALGAQAVGLFASDKPSQDINPTGLLPQGRALLARASAAWALSHPGTTMTAETVAGFVGGWVLFHEVLPRAHSADRAALLRAAMSLDLPMGSEINGAGVRFAGDGQADAGQNRRAVGVIWEWVAAGDLEVVFPPAYAKSVPTVLPISA